MVRQRTLNPSSGVRIPPPQLFFASTAFGESAAALEPNFIKKKKTPRSRATRGTKASLIFYEASEPNFIKKEKTLRNEVTKGQNQTEILLLDYIKKEKTLRNEVTKGRAQDMPYFYTYILECADGSLYVGCTNNLEKRIEEHNSFKRGAHYTKIRRPVIFKYSEKFRTLLKARRREAEIKSWKREKKLELIKFGN